jgi:predicted nucleic acid-binding protein
MIVLDTNVVSEAMKPSAHPAVTAWLDAQVADTIYLSSVTLAELLFGIGILPAGRRSDALAATLDGLLDAFGQRILPFDTNAARVYADVATRARAAGQGLPIPEGYIAAIAAAHGYAVATRDAAPFVAVGVTVIDPWTSV